MLNKFKRIIKYVLYLLLTNATYRFILYINGCQDIPYYTRIWEILL